MFGPVANVKSKGVTSCSMEWEKNIKKICRLGIEWGFSALSQENPLLFKFISRFINPCVMAYVLGLSLRI